MQKSFKNSSKSNLALYETDNTLWSSKIYPRIKYKVALTIEKSINLIYHVTRIKGNFFKMIKIIYEEPTTYIILYSMILNAFPSIEKTLI